MKPEKRPASKKPKPRKTKAQRDEGESYRIKRLGNAILLKAEINHIQSMKTKCLLIGILIGIGIGYGLHSAVTWV